MQVAQPDAVIGISLDLAVNVNQRERKYQVRSRYLIKKARVGDQVTGRIEVRRALTRKAKVLAEYAEVTKLGNRPELSRRESFIEGRVRPERMAQIDDPP